MSNETTTAIEPEMLPAEPEPANLMRAERRQDEDPRGRPQVVRMDEAEAPSRIIVRMSEHVDQLFAAIAAAQTEEGYGDVERTRTARVESARAKYSYDYETLEDVLGATRPHLAKHGVALMQFPMPGKTTVTVRTMLAHASGQWLSNDIVCSIVSTAPQDIASGITFMCRYALKAICAVAAGYDDDGAAASGLNRQAPPQAAPRKSEQQRQEAKSAADPHIGTVAEGPAERDGVYYVKLSTGFRCATRSAELAKALEAHKAAGNVIELTCKAPSSPKFAPTLEEIAIHRGAQA